MLTQLGRAVICCTSWFRTSWSGLLRPLVEALGQAGGALAPGILMAMAKAVAVALVVLCSPHVFLIRLGP